MTCFKWAAVLIVILLLDTLLTLYIGYEANPFLLWVMEVFNLDLAQMLGIRLAFLAPAVMFLALKDKARITAILYVILYISLTTLQYVKP